MNETVAEEVISQEATTATTGESQNTTTQTATTPEFSVPEAYKEKGWTQNIKSQDDVWKMLDNAQGQIGKKAVVPDFDKATPKEIDDYIAQLRPQDKAVYKFSDDMPEEQKTAYADMLHEIGIPAYQANKLIEKYQSMEAASVAKLYDKDEFIGELKKSFGNEYEKVSGETAKLLAANLNADDKALLEKLPNPALGLIYRAVANLNKAYGASESGSAANVPAQVSAVNVEEQAAKLRNDIISLSKRQHTAEEKQTLVDQLDALYVKKG